MRLIKTSDNSEQIFCVACKNGYTPDYEADAATKLLDIKVKSCKKIENCDPDVVFGVNMCSRCSASKGPAQGFYAFKDQKL